MPRDSGKLAILFRPASIYPERQLSDKLLKENLPKIHSIVFNIENECIKSISTNNVITKIRKRKEVSDATR